jgi:hypothetical protein
VLVLVCDEELECLIEFVVDVLRLHLLGHQVRDDGVNPAKIQRIFCLFFGTLRQVSLAEP